MTCAQKNVIFLFKQKKNTVTAYWEDVLSIESNEIEKSIFSCKILYEPLQIALKVKYEISMT